MASSPRRTAWSIIYPDPLPPHCLTPTTGLLHSSQNRPHKAPLPCSSLSSGFPEESRINSKLLPVTYNFCTIPDLSKNCCLIFPRIPLVDKVPAAAQCFCLLACSDQWSMRALILLLLSVISHFSCHLLCEADAHQPSHRRVPSPAYYF